MREFFPFPFTDTSPFDWTGQLTIAKNLQPSPMMTPFERVSLGLDGKVSGSDTLSQWGVEEGVLLLFDDRGAPLYKFNGAEIRNGTMYAIGESLLEASFSGFARCVLYPFLPVTKLNLKVAISSHMSYCKDTVPRLLRSLKRAGINDEDILVFIGGARETTQETLNGIQRYCVEANKMGWTAAAMVAQVDQPDYWLLLSDTCEVTEDFGGLLEEVDAGIQYDIIRIANDKRHDLGFFSGDFLSRQNNLTSTSRLDKVGHELLGNAELVSVIGGESNSGASRLRDKDVYGLGTNRSVLLYRDIGIKKYVGQTTTGGKP